MKWLTGFSILIAVSALTINMVQTATAADATGQSMSAPLQVMVAPLAVSSSPASVTFAPPRAAPASPPPDSPQTHVQQVTVLAQPKDLLPIRGGYRRIVLHGQELFCRNDLATGSHATRDPLCLTPEQWKKQQLRAEEWIRDVEHRAAATPASPMNVGGVLR
jgi:hypothetical protein